MQKFNVIAIGGTGMRCAECLVHLCSMGMFDDTEVHLLALDTDYENGNFKRLQELINNYNRVTADRDGVASDTLFSAKIVYYSFSPNYKAGTTYNGVANYNQAETTTHDEDGVKWSDADLTNLFLTPDMRDMDLQHGYRAQTQMGSMLMYHAIKEEAYKNRSNGSDLVRYVQNLMDGSSIVFLFGSVFGGTGASSIPILPHALQEAAKIISDKGNGDVLSKNYFGTVMLTNYFSFDVPNTTDKVYATSDKFALNSQAALAFYNEDETVNKTYKRLYLIGRDTPRNVSSKDARSVTGGDSQRNPEDYIELMAASAAYDFFHTALRNADKPVFGDKAEVYYRTIGTDENDNLTFESFFGEDREKFAQKCGIMMASAFLFGPQDFASNRRAHTSFQALTEQNVKDIRDYFRRFYDLECLDEKEPGSGWIKQMQESATDQGYRGFLFNEAAYSTSSKSAGKFKYNQLLYPTSSAHGYQVSMLGSAYDTFKKEFGDTVFTDSDKTAVSALLKRTYTTFSKLFGFTA